VRFGPLLSHARDLIRHAVPVILARSGVMVLALVDTVMVGRFAAGELAALGLAQAPVMTLLLIGIGLTMGTLVMTASAFGAGRDAVCGAVWWRAVRFITLAGAAGSAICLFSETILRGLGQTPEMAASAGLVARVLGLGLAPQLIFITTQFFLEGLRRPWPGTLMMIAANVLNAALNWVLVFGNLGAPPLGALGSAWSTTIVRCFLAAGILLFVAAMRDRRRFLVPGTRLSPADVTLQRRIGHASAVSIGVEGAAFNTLSIFAGWLGAVPLAAYTIALNLVAFVFMVAIGFGASTAVLVSHGRGRGDPAEAALAGWLGLGLAVITMAVIGGVIALMPETIAALYTDDPALRAAAAAVIALAAFVVVADGGQGVMAAALRGYGDTWIASGLHAFSFFAVMVPLAHGLSRLHGAGGHGC
jgi:MATE family multidrug resistance protein